MNASQWVIAFKYDMSPLHKLLSRPYMCNLRTTLENNKIKMLNYLASKDIALGKNLKIEISFIQELDIRF
jgi:hypothetical protein